MKSLIIYINEKIKDLPDSVKGLIVFDIDDTILKVDPSKISIYKKEPGKQEVSLSTDEFAKDPDAGDPDKRDWFDYRDFRDPVKVYNSIISGTPLIKNLKIMDDYIQAGYDFCFLTARSCEDTVKKAITDLLDTAIEESSVDEVAVINCNNVAGANEWIVELQQSYPAIKFIPTELSAAVGVHAGEGTLGLTWVRNR